MMKLSCPKLAHGVEWKHHAEADASGASKHGSGSNESSQDRKKTWRIRNMEVLMGKP